MSSTIWNQSITVKEEKDGYDYVTTIIDNNTGKELHWCNGICENPEDMTWNRDIGSIAYTFFEAGIRAAKKEYEVED